MPAWCQPRAQRAQRPRPRPCPLPLACAALISSQSADGSASNLAPFSYFNVVAHAPPHVAVGFAASRLRPHGRKDTLVNILESGWALSVAGRATACLQR